MAKNPHIIVTDFEADLPAPYTASTLAYLKARSPLVLFPLRFYLPVERMRIRALLPR